MLIITGATGHIGSKTTERVLARGEKARLPSAAVYRVGDLIDRAYHNRGDGTMKGVE